MRKAFLILLLSLFTSPAFAFGDGGLDGPLGPVGQPAPAPACHPVYVPGQGYTWVCQ